MPALSRRVLCLVQLVSGVKANLVDWAKYARPCEQLLATTIAVLLAVSLGGHSWLCGGTSDGGKVAHIGLYAILEQESANAITSTPTSTQLDAMCAAAVKVKTASAHGEPVACALATGGRIAGRLCIAALIVALILVCHFALEALDASRGVLNSLRAKIPPGMLPVATKLAKFVPFACWSILLLASFFSLLLFALFAPGTLGSGMAVLGLSYGLTRFAMLLSLMGLAVECAFVLHIGEDQAVSMLDALNGTWAHLATRQKITEVLLLAALVCELLLWLQRIEWGSLLIVFGLHAYTQSNRDHLSAFAALAIFSMATDALNLASADGRTTHGGMGLAAPVLTWAVLLCKLGAVTMLVYTRAVFF